MPQSWDQSHSHVVDGAELTAASALEPHFDAIAKIISDAQDTGQDELYQAHVEAVCRFAAHFNAGSPQPVTVGDVASEPSPSPILRASPTPPAPDIQPEEVTSDQETPSVITRSKSRKRKGDANPSDTPPPHHPEGPPQKQVRVTRLSVSTPKVSSGKVTAQQKPTTKRKSHQKSFTMIKKMTSPTDFIPLTRDISQEYTIARTAQIRDKYHQLLLGMKKPGTSDELLFDKPEYAAQLASFFFGETIGAEGLQRIMVFVNGYTGAPGEPDVAAVNRLKALSRNRDMPPNMRTLFACCSMELSRSSSNSRRPGSQSLDDIIQHIEEVASIRSLLHRFKQVQKDIMEKDSATEAFLAREKLTTSRGIGKASIAIQVISQVMSIDREFLKNKCDRARCMEILCGKLGDAFVLTTPPTSISFLQKIGVKRLGPACDLLLAIYPIIKPTVKLLDDAIWAPYSAGHQHLAFHTNAIHTSEPTASIFHLLRTATNSKVEEPKYIDPPDSVPHDRILEVETDDELDASNDEAGEHGSTEED